MKRLFFIFSIPLLLFTCSSSDDADGSQNLSGTYVTAKVNGVDFFADSDLSAISAQLYEYNSIFGFGLAAVQYDGGNSASTIGIGLGGIDFDLVTDGFEVSGINQDFNVSGQYVTSTTGSSAGGASDEDAYIKITSIDKENQVISGEFYFVAIDNDNPDITYTVTNGIFNDVSYVIEN